MSHAQARIAIEKKLATWAALKSPKLNLVLGVSSAKPTESVYFRGFLLPATTNAPYLHADGLEYSGMYQVSIVCSATTALKVPEGYIDELSNIFMVDSKLEQGTFYGIIVAPVDQGPTIVEDSKYTVPVTIRYRGMVSIPT